MENPVANVMVMKDDQGVAEELAQRFTCAAVRGIAERGAFCAAIPGGSSPRKAFELLASPEYSGLIPWHKVQIFFTDERCVAPDHAESNYRQAQDLLLSKVSIPAENVHRFAGELPPEEAASAYEQQIGRVVGSDSGFDLVILGMGADTHTASLFPGSKAVDVANRLAVANYAEKLEAWRLTLTYPAINSAREVIIVAVGTDKADAVKTAVRTDPDPHVHPVQGIRPYSGRLLWLLDSEAASQL